MKQKNEQGFEWPEFTSETERIKHNSIKYAKADPGEAMMDFYGVKTKLKKISSSDEVYRDVQPGELIYLKIKEVNKKAVIFDNESFKENITSAVNLFQYKRFKDSIPNKPVLCKVISKDSNKIVVDPLSPLYDEWIATTVGSMKEQYNLKKDKSLKVEDLVLGHGGFTGNVKIDTVSKFCGQDICIKAFIPGSQIVLNIEKDFEKWIGQSVKAFVTNYVELPGGRGQMSLICSAKEYIKFQGDKNKVKIFNAYCLDGEEWKEMQKEVHTGIVTGVINSNKKKGVFVEVPGLSITGIVNVDANELSKWHAGDEVKVCLSNIEEPMVYDPTVGQMQHKQPFIIENDVMKKCLLRFVFKFA